jgi:hypothetical protein
VPAGTVSSSAQILNYNIFATTGSNTFNGSQTIKSGGALTLSEATGGSDNYINLSSLNQSTLYIQNQSVSSGYNSGSVLQLTTATGSNGFGFSGSAVFQMDANYGGKTAKMQVVNINGVGTSVIGLADTITFAKVGGFPNTPSDTFTVDANTITLNGEIATSLFNSTSGGVAIDILTGSINTKDAIIFSGTPSSSANISLAGATDFRTTYYVKGTNTGSVINYVNDTSNYKVAWEYEAKSNGKTGGFALQNLSGSTSLIIQAETIECSGSIKLQKGSNKQSDIVSVGSSGATVTNSLVSTNSIILVTTQNSSVGGDEYPAVVGTKSAGSFTISHNYGGTLEVGYLIINATP